MTMTFELRKTPKGREYVYSTSTGLVDEEQARDFNARFRTDGIYDGKPLLSVLANDATFTVESRKLLTSAGTDLPVSAMVITSAPLRVMLNFMIKAAQLTREKPIVHRNFNTAEEALGWMDEELDKQGL